MKMVYCTCNVSILEDLLNVLEEQNISDYQIYDKVRAKNRKGAPRLDNAVWPGHNSSVMMQIRDEEKVKALAEAVKDMNENAINENELIVFCSWTLDDYFFE